MGSMKVFAERMETLRKNGRKNSIDAFLVVSENNMRYLSWVLNFGDREVRGNSPSS